MGENTEMRLDAYYEGESAISAPHDDAVNHPRHYRAAGGMEAIDVIEAFTQELAGSEAVCTANALKYMLRWKNKNGVEDLKKARWYLNRLIDRMESEPTKTISRRRRRNETLGDDE